MQSYQFTLSPAGNNAASTIYATGNLFVFESANTTGDNRVIVKPDTGGEIILKPGQRFRPDETRATAWNVKLVGTDAVSGVFIIGEGEFDDANIKIDSSSGALTVIPQGGFQIVNDAAHRVPVQFDPTATLLQSAPIMAYTDSTLIAAGQSAGNVAIKVIDPVKNVNGIIVCDYNFTVTGLASVGSVIGMLAKASAPTNRKDGDLFLSNALDVQSGAQSYIQTPDISKKPLIRLPPGKGLWLIADLGFKWTSDLNCLYQVL